MKLKWFFAQICVFKWTKVKWCFGRVFYHFTIFGFKNTKIKFLEKIRVFSAFFFRIEVQMISNPSSQLEKESPNPWFFADEGFFYDFLKKCSFLAFSNIFKIKSTSHTIIIVCILCYVNMLDQAQYSFFSPFFNSYSFKTGVHFRF